MVNRDGEVRSPVCPSCKRTGPVAIGLGFVAAVQYPRSRPSVVVEDTDAADPDTEATPITAAERQCVRVDFDNPERPGEPDLGARGAHPCVPIQSTDEGIQPSGFDECVTVDKCDGSDVTEILHTQVASPGKASIHIATDDPHDGKVELDTSCGIVM
jgi:hypothetical protein